MAHDLRQDREERVMPIVPTTLHVYDDGGDIISDRVSTDENIQLSREYLDSSE